MGDGSAFPLLIHWSLWRLQSRPLFNSAWSGRKGLVCGHRENFCLQGCLTCLHLEDYRNFLIKANFVGSLVFWCGSCSWKTGLCLRLYCLPMAQQPATHISEPTPHKQARSCFCRAGRVRRAWDHHDIGGPPLLIVSWGWTTRGSPKE